MAEKFLIIRLSSIGDIIQASGVPRVIKKKFPQSEVHWLVRQDLAELISNPYVDRAIAFDRALGFKGWLSLARRLRSEKFTHIYDAHNNLRSHTLCYILKGGFFSQPYAFIRRSKNRFKRFLLFWFKLNLFPKPYRATESFIAPLKKWGILSDHLGGEFSLSSIEKEKASTLLNEHVLRQKFLEGPSKTRWLALAPATAWPKKSWPPENWVKLIEQIIKQSSFNLVILGGKNDDFCKTLVIDTQRVLNLQGQLTLTESVAVVAQTEKLIAADTGLLHLAEAVHQDVIALLGPTPFGGPSRRQSVALQKSVWCQPCSKDGSGPCYNPTYQACMKKITPSDVIDALPV